MRRTLAALRRCVCCRIKRENGVNRSKINAVTLGGRIDRLRTRMGLSIEALACRSDLNKNTVNRIVRGVGQPHLGTFFKLCSALDVSPGDLMEAAPESYRVMRRLNRVDEATEERRPGVRLSFPRDTLPGSQLNCEVIEIASSGPPESHPGEELLVCLSGRVGIHIGGLHEELNPTDAIQFYGTESHRYYNADRSDPVAVALSIRT